MPWPLSMRIFIAEFVLRFTPLSYTKSAVNARGMAWAFTPFGRSGLFWTELPESFFKFASTFSRNHILPKVAMVQCDYLLRAFLSSFNLRSYARYFSFSSSNMLADSEIEL